MDQPEPDAADLQLILQGKRIQPVKPFLPDLPCVKVVLCPVAAQAPVPVPGNPVVAVFPNPVAGLVAFRSFAHRVPQEPDVIRPYSVQLLFHGPGGNHVPVKIRQKNNFHSPYPSVCIPVCPHSAWGLVLPAPAEQHSALIIPHHDKAGNVRIYDIVLPAGCQQCCHFFCGMIPPGNWSARLVILFFLNLAIFILPVLMYTFSCKQKDSAGRNRT